MPKIEDEKTNKIAIIIALMLWLIVCAGLTALFHYVIFPLLGM